MLPYFLAWFPMLLLAVINGILREAVIKKWVGNATAHQLSTFTLLLLFALYIYVIILRYPPATAEQALLIGLLWLVLTLAFEFGFGRFRGNSWATLLQDYNLLKGRLWIIIPLWVLFAPFLFYHFIGRK